LTDLVHNTPIIQLPRLSSALGHDILAKVEYLSPGGSSKDRLALAIIRNAEQTGQIIPHQNYTIYEGTVGSTGISLATFCNALGYNCNITMPADVAPSKIQQLELLGVKVELVPPASIIDPLHFVNVAREKASKDVRGYFANQFENMVNFGVHFDITAAEIVAECGDVDAVVLGSGTGGTIAGISARLKQHNERVQIWLADPPGSGLYNKVNYNVMFNSVEAEGTRKRHQVDTIVEGVGLTRLTNNFKAALPFIDGAIRVTDQEAVSMSRWICKNEGLFVGSSSCVNLCAVVKLAAKLPPNSKILTMLCDSGSRHVNKFWSPEFLAKEGLDHSTPETLDFIEFNQ
jgi:cysteine synthase A